MSRPLPTRATINDEDDDIVDTDDITSTSLETHSTREQTYIEEICRGKIQEWLESQVSSPNSTFLSRNIHTAYLQRGLQELSAGYSSLDASRPWIVFWIVHGLSLLEIELPLGFVTRCVSFLSACQNDTGGFGGGPGQTAHLAPTYASVAALFELSSQPGGENALNIINRDQLYQYLLRVKHPDGGFRVTEDGEADTRGAYTALAVASMLNIMTDELIQGTAEWIASCQTYEGGIGGEPGNEAHGGYAYCGLASLIILNRTELLDCSRLLKWAAQRQMSTEGGFQGRTNKLVDGCYSFWVGALFPLLDRVIRTQATKTSSSETDSKSSTFPIVTPSHGWLFDGRALQKYILVCCQFQRGGGLVDKPGKGPDYYHTSYCLSGLSIAQNQDTEAHSFTLGITSNRLHATDPIYNVDAARLPSAMAHFAGLPKPTSTSTSTSTSTFTSTSAPTSTSTSTSTSSST